MLPLPLEDITYQDVQHMDCYGGKWQFVSERRLYPRRAVGRRRSHIGILRYVKALSIAPAMILEDDCELTEDWESIVLDALGELPAGWLQLYLTDAVTGISRRISQRISRVESCGGASQLHRRRDCSGYRSTRMLWVRGRCRPLAPRPNARSQLILRQATRSHSMRGFLGYNPVESVCEVFRTGITHPLWGRGEESTPVAGRSA